MDLRKRVLSKQAAKPPQTKCFEGPGKAAVAAKYSWVNKLRPEPITVVDRRSMNWPTLKKKPAARFTSKA